ncbi:MAG TPA: beta-propeller fold lactonase family protein [Microvirga sp.]|nr:beta-propeller fold lactonase family protein [Microvirga sp.]
MYVACAGSNEIHVLGLGTDGSLDPLRVVPLPDVAEPGGSTPLALSPDRRFLYAGVRSQPFRVVAFAVDPASGALSHLGNAPLADSMAYLATDRTGRWLFGASYGGGRVSVNPVAPDGRVGPPLQVEATEPKAHAIEPEPSNAAVLATSLGGDMVHRFRFDPATGALSGGEAAARVAAGSGPRHFVRQPSGRFLFLLNELSATVDVFAIAASGALRPVETVSALPEGFTGKPWAADLHLTSDGRLLFASERTSSTLQGFRVDPDSGRLTPCGSTPTETQPRGFAIAPSGRFLVASGEVSHGVAAYAIDPASGSLARTARREVGRTPNWVEILDLTA